MSQNLSAIGGGVQRSKDYIYEGKNADLGWLVSSSRGDNRPHMDYGGQTISVTRILDFSLLHSIQDCPRYLDRAAKS